MKDLMDYPTTLTLNEKQLSTIKNYKVGTKLVLEVNAEVMSVGKDVYSESSQLHCTIKITKVSQESEENPLSENEKRGMKGYR